MSLKGTIYTLALGAGAMYLYDPERGRRRRALLEDRIGSVSRDLETGFERACRDLSNRFGGAVSELSSMLSSEAVPEEVLSQRVRSKIGRLISNPRSVEVAVENGRNIVLRGAVANEEVQPLIAGLRRIRGVRQIKNELQVQERTGDRKKPQTPSSRLGRNLSPGERLLTGGLGTSLLLSALTRGGVRGAFFAAAGVSLLNKSLAELPFETQDPWPEEEKPEETLPH